MIGVAYPMKVSEVLLTTARDEPLKAIEMVNNFSFAGIASKPSNPGPGTWLHGSNRALMRRALTVAQQHDGLNLFEHDFGVCDRYAAGLQAAAAVRCPVHMILGERDQMTTPKASRELAAALKARVVMLPAGHSLPLELPDAVLEALRTALA
jgi:pimeloyl-ACP methyl ester carboxylesterase